MMSKLFFLVLILSFFVSGCGLEASIENLSGNSVEVRADKDFEYGEKVVTTWGTPNYEVTGVFFELSEPQKTSNGYEIQGVLE